MLSRTQIGIGLATVAVVVTASILYFQSGPEISSDTVAVTSPASAGGSSALEQIATTASAIPAEIQPIATSTTQNVANVSAVHHRAYVQQRTALLQDLAMDSQDSSLQTILGELSNRDPEIRKAAREAAVQFASRDAIPRLLETAAQTEDPREKEELIEAAEFLKLPSLTEVMERRGIKPVLTAKPAPGKQFPAFTRRIAPASPAPVPPPVDPNKR